MILISGIIRHLINRVRDDRLYKSPPHQGLKGVIKRMVDKPPSYIPKRRINIFLNRYCNLSCFSCAALGMDPPRDETTLEEIIAFLQKMVYHDPGSTVMLTGGEPTAIDHGKLKEICDEIHDHGFKTAMLTNGFKIAPVEWFDYIILDKHGINDADIKKWEKHLKAHGRDIDYREKYHHMDIPYSIEGNITKGARCNNWIHTLTLWRDVVYPCCNIMCVAWWADDYNKILAPALRKNGWTVDNPELANTIRNWRETLPAEVYRICTLLCWKEAPRTKWVKINGS